MKSLLIIFAISLFVRIANLLVINLNIDTYIVEDQNLYWNWALAKSFTNNSTIETATLLERMPGAFLFYQFLIFLVGKSLFGIFFIQSILDSINCVLIAFIARKIKPSLFILAGYLAAFSPLMIIISSQMLSDTLFLFFFLIFIYLFIHYLKKEKTIILVFSALFLGLSIYVRTISFPLVLGGALTLLIINITNNKKVTYLAVRNFFIFLIFSIAPIFDRLYSNIINYNSLALTTQKGTHLVYWVVPAVLDFTNSKNKIQYHNDLEIIKNKKFNDKNPFLKSDHLTKFGITTLIASDPKAILLAWTKGALINIFAPSFLLDSRIRNLEHPSFYKNNRNVYEWLTQVAFIEKYSTYKKVLIVLLITNLLFVVFFIIGLYALFKHSKLFFLLSIIMGFYFLMIVGPVYSPKYIHPLICIIIVIEAFAIETSRTFLFSNKTKV